MPVLSVLLAAFVAGLVGSPHCLGMCGGFAAACARPRGAVGVPAAPFWHLGRLATYAGLGALAGAFGAVVPGPRWVPAALSAALLLWFAASLAGLVPAGPARIPLLARAGAVLARRDGPGWRFLFGMATGLLPCGMVYAAMAMAVAAGSAGAGAATMVAFGAGTVPALTLLTVTVRRLVLRGVWMRRVLALLVLAAGLGSVGMRLVRTPSPGGHGHHGMSMPMPQAGDSAHAPASMATPGASPATPRHEMPAVSGH